jgi:hypothetical protein
MIFSATNKNMINHIPEFDDLRIQMKVILKCDATLSLLIIETKLGTGYYSINLTR